MLLRVKERSDIRGRGQYNQYVVIECDKSAFLDYYEKVIVRKICRAAHIEYKNKHTVKITNLSRSARNHIETTTQCFGQYFSDLAKRGEK